jgi:hypothetical protein
VIGKYRILLSLLANIYYRSFPMLKVKRKVINPLKGNVSKNTVIILELLSIIVTVIIVGFVAPYLSAYFNSLSNPKPDVYILQDKCAITPLWGTDLVAFKGVIKNKGSIQENSIIVKIEVSEPFRHSETNTSIIERNIGSIRAGQTITISTPIKAPSVDYLNSCSITIRMTILGESKVWDDATFSETW